MRKFLSFCSILFVLFNASKAFCEDKFFVVVISAYNNEEYCEQNLTSVFKQTYPNYRVIYIDDASSDHTVDKVTALVREHQQKDRFTLIRNKERVGSAEMYYRAIRGCDDQDVIVMLNGDDWLYDEHVLEKVNGYYNKGEIWMTSGTYVDYPGYKKGDKLQKIPYRITKINAIRKYSKRGKQIPSLKTFYAGLFKQINLQDLMQNGKFIEADSDQSFMFPIFEMAGKHSLFSNEPLYVRNLTNPLHANDVVIEMQREALEYLLTLDRYKPLRHFSRGFEESDEKRKADLVIFSYDRPMQLLACIESIERYITDVDRITVIFRCSTPGFSKAYEEVQAMFPKIHFMRQSNNASRDFKPLTIATIFSHPAEYVAFVPDDVIVKDYIHFRDCIEAMQKTGAYGFYLRLGKHIDYCYRSNAKQSVPRSVPVGDNIFAWQFTIGEEDWRQPNSLDMTLFKKSDIKDDLMDISFNNISLLEQTWNQKTDLNKVGLFYSESKIVNVPLNVVDASTNRHMHSYTKEELLELFKDGMKMDIFSLFQTKNRSPHMEYDPAFRKRQ
jgi:glycosyltransferase involved in cell wall biosynthesis